MWILGMKETFLGEPWHVQKNDPPEMGESHACIIYAERRASLRGKDTFLENF